MGVINYYRKEHVFWHGIRSLIIFLASNYLTGSQTRSPGLNIDQFFFLKYYGNWSLTEAYSLPVGLRKWFVDRLMKQLDLVK